MFWAPVFLLVALVAGLVGFTGILGEELVLGARVLFVLFLSLFFGSAVLQSNRETPKT